MLSPIVEEALRKLDSRERAAIARLLVVGETINPKRGKNWLDFLLLKVGY